MVASLLSQYDAAFDAVGYQIGCICTSGYRAIRGEFPDLDTPVLQFFDEADVENVDGRKRDMTLRDLLTMSDGLLWNENLLLQRPR